MNFPGHYHAPVASRIRRLPAGVKLAVALGIILATVLVPAGWTAWFGLTAVGLLAVALASGIPLVFLGKRLLWLSPFVLGVALMNALHPAAQADWRIIAARGVLCLTTVLLLANTTPFHESLRVLRRVRVPVLLITTLALMHRYLFVLVEEAERMRRARAARTFVRHRRSTWRVVATVAGRLFVRASERAERIYAAMCARGWQ